MKKMQFFGLRQKIVAQETLENNQTTQKSFRLKQEHFKKVKILLKLKNCSVLLSEIIPFTYRFLKQILLHRA